MNNTDELKKIISEMNTGDLLLFDGMGYWFSYLIEWMTWSDFSHCGMILKDPIYLDPKLKGIYMLESGTEKFPDAVEHRICFGVQIVNLEKVIENYYGHIWYRKLNAPISIKEEFSTKLFPLWSKIKDLPYDDNIYDLIRVEFDLDWGDMKRTNKFFCSALQTFLYQKMDLFNEDNISWDMIKPCDFDDGGKIEKLLSKEVDMIPKIQLK